jgi:hypothetical protein
MLQEVYQVFRLCLKTKSFVTKFASKVCLAFFRKDGNLTNLIFSARKAKFLFLNKFKTKEEILRIYLLSFLIKFLKFS